MLDKDKKNCYSFFMEKEKLQNRLKQANRDFYYSENNGNIEFYHINNSVMKDIFPIDVGHEKHLADEKPVVNRYPYYLLHYVVSGKGYVELDGKTTAIGRGTVFVLPPNKDVVYYPDRKTPWDFCWINFNGLAAKNLLDLLGLGGERICTGAPVPSVRKYFFEALAAKDKRASRIFTVTSCLFRIFAEIAEREAPRSAGDFGTASRFEQIFAYVSEHLFDSDLSAKNLAEKFYVNPCYFSTLFKKNVNVSFKEYLNYERIKKATELLETTNLLIKEVANTVGFPDPLYFGKVFRKYRMVSPDEYRKTKITGTPPRT